MIYKIAILIICRKTYDNQFISLLYGGWGNVKNLKTHMQIRDNYIFFFQKHNVIQTPEMQVFRCIT